MAAQRARDTGGDPPSRWWAARRPRDLGSVPAARDFSAEPEQAGTPRAGGAGAAGTLRGGRGLRAGGGGPSPAGVSTGMPTWVPAANAGAGRPPYSCSLQHFVPKELNRPERAARDLHLFSLRAKNSTYSVIFRNLSNYSVRQGANYTCWRSEMRVIGRVIRVLRTLGRIFVFTPCPGAIQSMGALKETHKERIWPTSVN